MILLVANTADFTQDEYIKAENFISKERLQTLSSEDKLRSLAGRILLLRAIKKLYSREDFEITYGENGKPELDFCFFSISHSGPFVACAVSDFPIGVDIEQITEIKQRPEYKFFSKEESNYINKDGSYKEKFYTVWTAKEAFVKAIGGKLSQFSDFSVVSKSGELKYELNNYVIEITQTDKYLISLCRSLNQEM